MSFLGLGGPSGSGTSSTPSGSTAQAYQPQFQPVLDQTFWNNINSFAQPAAQQYTAGQNVVTNPYQDQSLQGAQTVAGLGTPYGQGLVGQGQQLAGYGQQTLNTAFDPQQGLYNQQSIQNLNNQNAINAMSGVAGTPYAAGITGQSQQNFNTNWLNQQLGRQATGLQAGGNALTQGAQLGTTGLNTIGSASNAPYANYNTLQNNNLAALSSSLGISQQTLQDILPYLGLGQAASSISGQLGQQGVNQLTSGLSGIGAGLGLIGGGSSIGSGIGSLFGSTGAATSGGVVDDALGATDAFGGASGSGLLGGLASLFA